MHVSIGFKKCLSAVCLLASIGFGVAGFCVSPVGEIHSSVLFTIAQFLTASGTFIGLDVYIHKFKNFTNHQ